MNDKLKNELDSFQNIWEGGYTQSYALDRGQYKLAEFVKKLNFNRCLEIGCGRGHWSEMLAKRGELVVIDAKSKEDNDFKVNCEYFKVRDFSLNEIQNFSIDCVFSYDVFCHISKSGQEQYIKNLYDKMTDGAVGYIMIADARKFNKNNHAPPFKTEQDILNAEADADGQVAAGRWYWIGLKTFVNLLKKYGFIIVVEDIDIDPSAPIVMFRKPEQNSLKEVVKQNRDCCRGIQWITKERWNNSGDKYGLPFFCFDRINEPLTDEVSYSDIIVYLLKQYNCKEYLEIGISVLKNLFQVAHNTDVKIMGFDINEINSDVEIPRPWGFVKGNVMVENDWRPLKELNLKHDLIFSDALHNNEGLQAEFDYYIKDHLADKWIIIWDDAWQAPTNYIKKYLIPVLRKKYGEIFIQEHNPQEWVRGQRHPILIVSNFKIKSLDI